MQVIVTRPEHEARRWQTTLDQRGLKTVVLPLIQISPIADRETLHSAWLEWSSFRAVMFVSANAVRFFFEGRPSNFLAQAWPFGQPQMRAWATGPGTVGALKQAGVSLNDIDAPSADQLQFDSEALWAVVNGQVGAGQRVLVVRGGDGQGAIRGRDWLVHQLGASGVAVHQIAAYCRSLPAWSPDQIQLAVEHSTAGSVWLFSSSEAIQNLRHLLPHQSWAEARAVATHPRIARAAREAGFGVVCESRPGISDVVASIESMA